MSGVTSPRKRGSFVDALRTIGVLGAMLIASFFVGKILTTKPDRPAPEVTLRQAVESARSVAQFDVVAPKRLPAHWQGTSVRTKPDAWHFGAITGQNLYVGLEQAVGEPYSLVRQVAKHSKVAGNAQIAGRNWQVRTETDGDRIYVGDFGKTVVLVLGSAPKKELERYVASLAPLS